MYYGGYEKYRKESKETLKEYLIISPICSTKKEVFCEK